jgi:hypothetical protein
MKLSREQALETLQTYLSAGEGLKAASFLADALINNGFVQAAALFNDAQGKEIAPDVWMSAITAIEDTPEGSVIDNVLYSPHNCHLMGVYPNEEDDEPEFTYSIGLWYNFQHPEILCLGLPNRVSGGLINEYAQEIADGNAPPLDTPLDGVLADGYQLQFKLCSNKAKTEYTCWASWFNGGLHYPVIQMIWQDKEYRWPWEEGFRPIQAQPLLT